jgi:O-antigen/teichoic acid export membrane protein
MALSWSLPPRVSMRLASMSVITTQKEAGFLHRAALLTGANFLAFALSFLTPLVIVRVFNQAEFGTYKQLFQILATAMTMLHLQIPLSAYYFMPREPTRRAQVAMNIVLFYLLVGLAVTTVFVAFPGWSAYIFRNPALDQYIPLLGLALTLWLMAANVEVFPLALGDLRIASAFIILLQTSKSLILIVVAIVFGNLKAVLWASIIQGAIQCVFMLGYIHFRIGSLITRPDRLFDLKLLKKQVSNSLPYGGGSMIQSLQTDLHNYFVSHYFSAAAFAVYANGCFQMPLITLLQHSFRDALTPEVARLEAAGDYQGIIHSWLNAMRKLSLIVMPMCALMFVLRHELIVALFTHAYADSVPIFSIYLISMLTQMVLTTSVMRSIPDFRYFRLKLNLTLTPLTFAALYVGVKLAGMIGVVTVTVSIHLFDIAICAIAICKRLRVKRQDLRPLAPVTKTAQAVIVAMMTTYLAKAPLASSHPIMTLVVCGMLFGVVYAIAAFAFGTLTRNEKDEVYSRAQALGGVFARLSRSLWIAIRRNYVERKRSF